MSIFYMGPANITEIKVTKNEYLLSLFRTKERFNGVNNVLMIVLSKGSNSIDNTEDIFNSLNDTSERKSCMDTCFTT